MVSQNMKVDSFKRFFNQGIWSVKEIEYLKAKGLITDAEMHEIINQPTTMSQDPRVNALQYEYEIWDKKSPINGVDAETVIRDSYLENAGDIVLIKLGNRVIEVSDIETLRSNHGITTDAQSEEVAELYATHLEEMKNTPQINMEDVKTAMTFMSDLKREHDIEEIKQLLTDIKTALGGASNA